MSVVDTRNIERDSLFLKAQLRMEGAGEVFEVKVRNLSAGGMMAEGGPNAAQGANLEVELRNIGWVGGSVAWVQDNRFGIAFTQEIDPKLARQPLQNSDHVAGQKRPATRLPNGVEQDPDRFRKI